MPIKLTWNLAAVLPFGVFIGSITPNATVFTIRISAVVMIQRWLRVFMGNLSIPKLTRFTGYCFLNVSCIISTKVFNCLTF